MQHGGPPSALVVREAEQLGAAASEGPVDALRVSLDFFGPVTTEPVRVSGEVVRAGRSVNLVDVHLEQDGRTALRGSVWLVRRDTEGATPVVPGPESGLPGPEDLAPFGVWHFPYIEHFDWSDWSFVNVSLDVQLLRPMAPDWLLLDARTRLAGTGTGLTLTTLHDRAGVVGHVGQNLVVGRRG